MTVTGIFDDGNLRLGQVHARVGDVAVINNDSLDRDGVDSVCDAYEGHDNVDEPEKITDINF
jgi:pectate lyase